MNFLEDIDEIYKQICTKNGIDGKDSKFSCFIPIEMEDYKSECGFQIKKQEKAKLLLLVGGQRIYISDIQVINTILAMDKEDIDWFLQQFIHLYKGQTSDIMFKINEKSYHFQGIQQYPSKKNIYLFSDSLITFNDFIFLLLIKC